MIVESLFVLLFDLIYFTHDSDSRLDVSHDEAKAHELDKQPKTTQTSHPAKAPFKRRTKHTHDKIK